MADASASNPVTLEAGQSQPGVSEQTLNTSTELTAQQQSLNSDSGLSKRPRDARLIHMVLANMGVNAYEERVPLQLLDFCYRYTSSSLQDALHLTSEFAQNVSGTGKISNANNDLNSITLQALRLSIAARTQYQFSPTLPKESLADLATEKNRVALPPLCKDWGLRLPPERYCMTGIGYGLEEEWDSEGEEPSKNDDIGDITMGEVAGGQEATEGGDETMEDVFGGDGA